MTQTTQRFGFHIGKCEDASSPQPMRFNFSPNAFAQIQLRAVGGQQVQTQLPLKTSNFPGDFGRLVYRMAIQNHKYGLGASHHQAIQKSADYPRTQSALFDHRPDSPSPIHRAEQIQPIPGPCTAHHRRLSFKPPRGPRMIVTTQTRFISKIVAMLILTKMIVTTVSLKHSRVSYKSQKGGRSYDWYHFLWCLCTFMETNPRGNNSRCTR